MAYIEHRANPKLPEVEAELNLHAVAETFGEDWLKENGQHPLQQLWQRPDFLATIELVTLGNALRGLAPHRKWLASQVKKAKTGDANNRRGALFEIVSLGALTGDNFTATPAPDNHPGVDAFVAFRSGARMRLSLKSYDVSSHQRRFESDAGAAWEGIKEKFKNVSGSGLQILVAAEHDYPTSGDWKKLRVAIARAHDEYKRHCPVEVVYPPWFVVVGRLEPAYGKLAEAPASLKAIIAARRHKNDAQNLISKLDEARANLETHSVSDPDVVNAVLVRVPSDASPMMCSQWAREYLDVNPSSPIGLVLLYQVDLVRSLDRSESFVCHSFFSQEGGVYRNWVSRWPQSDQSLHLSIPVGRVSTEPSEILLPLANGGHLNLENYYTFSRGDIYVEISKNGPINSLNVEAIGEGVFLHAVVADVGDPVLISPRQPRSERLLLF